MLQAARIASPKTWLRRALPIGRGVMQLPVETKPDRRLRRITTTYAVMSILIPTFLLLGLQPQSAGYWRWLGLFGFMPWFVFLTPAAIYFLIHKSRLGALSIISPAVLVVLSFAANTTPVKALELIICIIINVGLLNQLVQNRPKTLQKLGCGEMHLLDRA
jgi:hypothetical protein